MLLGPSAPADLVPLAAAPLGLVSLATTPLDLVPLATAAMLGFLHALEVDHMVAVTTFVSRRPSLRAAARFGLRWGIGHSAAVLLAGGLLLATGARWPARYEALGEALVGLMLVGLGVWTLATARKLHLHTSEEHGGHAHLHAHRTRGPHHHAHDAQSPATHASVAHSLMANSSAAHPSAADASAAHPHDHGGITLVGLLHGLAGTTGVVALVPVTMMDRVPLGLGYLTLFGVGVTLAMTLFALIAAAAMRRANAWSFAWGRRAVTAIGVCGIVVGCWWIVRSV